MRTVSFGLAILLSSLSVPAAGAQPSVAVARGARVRITAPDLGLRRRVAAVVDRRADTLVLLWPGRPDSASVALSSITRLELSRGQRRRTWAGAGIGFLAGAAILTIVGFSVEDGICSDDCSGLVFAIAIGGGAGAVLGAIAGSTVRSERWERVSPDLRVGFSATPSGGMVVVGLRL